MVLMGIAGGGDGLARRRIRHHVGGHESTRRSAWLRSVGRHETSILDYRYLPATSQYVYEVNECEITAGDSLHRMYSIVLR